MLTVDRNLLVRICFLVCVLNIALVLVLAGTGVLETAQPGDVRYVQTVHTEEGTLTLPTDSPRFVIENPTDADFFYNIALYVRHGGSMYPGNSHDPFVQLSYKYAPPIFLIFALLSFLGYFGFKIAWLAISVGSVVVGTYLLVQAETRHRNEVSRWTTSILAVATVGFQPMVANFKTAQSTPIMYLFVALLWWYHRKDRSKLGGGVLVGATLIKPYFTAPLAAITKRNDLRPILGFVGLLLTANVFSVLVFGFDTLVTYYSILWSFLIDEGTARSYASIDAWSASHLRPLYWLGDFAPLVRFLLVVPVAAVAIAHFFDWIDRPVEVFALSIVSLLISLETTTAIDAAMLLAVFVVIGYHLYRENGFEFRLLFLAFLLMQAHAYVLELLVGWGATNLAPIASNTDVIVALLPVLQPGVYAVFILFGLTLWPLVPDRLIA